MIHGASELNVEGAFWPFDGTGTGDGVGPCQIGAEQRGKAGQKSAEILEAHLPETREGVSAQEVPWRKGAGGTVANWHHR